MNENSLLSRTMRLLRDRPQSLPLTQVARDSGVGYEWLKKLYYGHIPDPGVNKIERLHAYLTAQGIVESAA